MRLVVSWPVPNALKVWHYRIVHVKRVSWLNLLLLLLFLYCFCCLSRRGYGFEYTTDEILQLSFEEWLLIKGKEECGKFRLPSCLPRPRKQGGMLFDATGRKKVRAMMCVVRMLVDCVPPQQVGLFFLNCGVVFVPFVCVKCGGDPLDLLSIFHFTNTRKQNSISSNNPGLDNIRLYSVPTYRVVKIFVMKITISVEVP